MGDDGSDGHEVYTSRYGWRPVDEVRWLEVLYLVGIRSAYIVEVLQQPFGDLGRVGRRAGHYRYCVKATIEPCEQ